MAGHLAEFRRELNWNIAHGTVELPVVGIDGMPTVVVAQEDERLFVLLGRLRAVGGSANLFVRGVNRVRQVSVVEQRSAVPSPDVDMTGDERPSGVASVGLFLDYLACHPNGVLLPAVNPASPALARDSRYVEFA